MSDKQEKLDKRHQALRLYTLEAIAKSEELLATLGDMSGKYADFVAKTRKKHKSLLAALDKRIAREKRKASNA